MGGRMNYVDRLVFTANVSSISAISWREQILYINLDTRVVQVTDFRSQANGAT
jgi:hypothetical protein